MFTGIIKYLGIITQAIANNGCVELSISSDLPQDELCIGSSIAHNGICLTVTELTGTGWKVFASVETVASTTIGFWKVGDLLNLEQSLRVGDRLDGHFVAGHVDGVVELLAINQLTNGCEMMVSTPPKHLQFIAAKGSIALDGLSLTVNLVTDTYFTVAIIPHSLAATNLHLRHVGDFVNFEIDLLARYCMKRLDSSL